MFLLDINFFIIWFPCFYDCKQQQIEDKTQFMLPILSIDGEEEEEEEEDDEGDVVMDLPRIPSS